MDSETQKTSPDVKSCGLGQAAILLGESWTLLIMRELLFGVTRFDAIQNNLGIPRSVLSKRLRRLVDAGVLRRREYKEEGQRRRLQYVLTPMGVELALPMIALMHWGRKHLTRDAAGGEIERRNDGAPIAIGLVDSGGQPVPLHEVAFRRSA